MKNSLLRSKYRLGLRMVALEFPTKMFGCERNLWRREAWINFNASSVFRQNSFRRDPSRSPFIRVRYKPPTSWIDFNAASQEESKYHATIQLIISCDRFIDRLSWEISSSACGRGQDCLLQIYTCKRTERTASRRREAVFFTKMAPHFAVTVRIVHGSPGHLTTITAHGTCMARKKNTKPSWDKKDRMQNP